LQIGDKCNPLFFSWKTNNIAMRKKE